MDSSQKRPLRRARSYSQNLHLDTFFKQYQTRRKDTETQSLSEKREKLSQPLYLHPLTVDPYVINRGFLLLDTPPMVAKADRMSLLPQGGQLGGQYLPSITGKLVRSTLSQSCPYLYNRRSSNASSTLQRTLNNIKQTPTRTQKETQRSDVTVTMIYMGQGLNRTSQDEVKVLQQICGGENLCVFKGPLCPGEQFQFKSQRHIGYPFSATFYVNGIMAGRISSCCEYRYTPGAHQGRKSCFKLTRLAGGKPCYRCVNARHVTPPPLPPKNDVPESCPSSPLFVPIGIERSLQGLRAPSKDGNHTSTDSDELEGARRARAKAKRRKPSLRRNAEALEGSQNHRDENDPKDRQVAQEKLLNVSQNMPHVSEGRAIAIRNTNDILDTRSNVIKNATNNPDQRQNILENKTSILESRSNVQNDRTNISENSQSIPYNKPNGPENRPNITENTQTIPENKSAILEYKPNFMENKQNAHNPQTVISRNPPILTPEGKDNPLQGHQTQTHVPQQFEKAKKNQDKKARKMERESGGNSGAGERDFFEECLEMSSSLETISNKKIWFKVHKQERLAVQEQISRGQHAEGSASELELSEESESGPNHSDDEIGPKSTVSKEEINKEDLQKQLNAIVEVLRTSDEVDELVLRNTGLTDELLQSLVAALKQSPSVVSTINLNLNLIGPMGVHSLLELLHSRPQLQNLYLFGNRLGDAGVQMLLMGLAELQTSTNRETGMPLQPQATQGTMILPPIPHQGPPFTACHLSELDLGGNGISNDGLRVLATYMRYHSQLRYLALAQTSGADMTTWTVLLESLKVNAKLAHIILDECSLGDHGAKLVAETLRANVAIKKVDLDGNGIGDIGGSAILDALASRKQSPLQHLSMEEGNFISTALMVKILQEVQANGPAVQNISLPLLPPAGVMQQ